MAITSLDELISSYKQIIPYIKTNSVTTVAGQPSILIDRTGFPAAATTNPGNVSSGIVPTDASTGFPEITNAQGSNKLYISRVEVSAPAAMSVWLFDVLFMAGQTTIPTSGTTTVTLTSRPSFASRVPFLPDGITRDWSQVELYIMSSAATGAQAHSVSVDYLDQAGNAGNTGTISTTSIIVNRILRCPLAAGDTGVSDVTGYNVNGVTSATGAVSVLAMRRLGKYRTLGGLSSIYGPDYTGLPEIFSNSALMAVVLTDATSSSTPDITIEIAQG